MTVRKRSRRRRRRVVSARASTYAPPEMGVGPPHERWRWRVMGERGNVTNIDNVVSDERAAKCFTECELQEKLLLLWVANWMELVWTHWRVGVKEEGKGESEAGVSETKCYCCCFCLSCCCCCWVDALLLWHATLCENAALIDVFNDAPLDGLTIMWYKNPSRNENHVALCDLSAL